MNWFKKNYLIFIAIILILPSIWPLFRTDFFRMHDWTHVARLVELDIALKAGQIPPRWAPDFGWGYGMPLFHFYPPLPYYFAELLYLIKLPAVTAIKLIFGLNFLAGFYFMYLWAKRFWGKTGAFISALSFVYLPYRAVNFYVRGALAELTAMTFLPLFYYSAGRLIKEKTPALMILTSLSLAAVFLSHNAIALFGVFFFGLYFLFKLGSETKLKSILFSAGAVLLSIGLAAFFIFPALFEKDLTIVNRIAGGFFHYGYHFVYLRQLFDRRWAYGGSVLGPNDDMSFQLGLPQLVLALFMIPVIIRLFKNRKKINTTEITYVVIALLTAVFLMTFHSRPIWDRLVILHITQFPWRLLAFAATYIAFLSGSVFYLVKHKQLTKLLLIIIVFLTLGLNLAYFKPEKFSQLEDYYYADRNNIQTHMSDVLLDYLPQTALKPTAPAPGLFDLKTTTMVVSADHPGSLIINQYFFPGWLAKINGSPVDIKPDSQLGRIEIDLPIGEQQVEVRLGKTQLQFWSDIISLLSWSGVIIFLGYKLKTKLS